jgi:SAM-dependent methyltransferase
MEVKDQNPAWLNESHPNFKRWQRARKLSIERGMFIYSIVNQKVKTDNLSVLDLGSGEGGTVKTFSEGNFVVSFDLSLVRLKRQNAIVISSKPALPSGRSFEMTSTINSNDLAVVNGTALQLPFNDQCFDVIIIQDVIEHFTDINSFYSEIKRVLKPNGFVFVSTPNKFSIFNFFGDPHFGLPIVSILNRVSIKKYFLKYLRKDDYKREDIAELFSLKELVSLFQKDFKISLNTKFSIQELFNGSKGIVWSDFHLKLIALCKYVKFDWLLNKIANDKFGLVNKFFTPTFYIILKKG